MKPVYEDLTTQINNLILALFGADYDGDVLNFLSMKDRRSKETMKRLRPQCLIVSKQNGRFNGALGLAKDYRLGLETFLN